MILGCAYNSLLTSYILGSNAEQLVSSLTDLARKSNIHLVVDKGSAVESVLLVIQSFCPKVSLGIACINFKY